MKNASEKQTAVGLLRNYVEPIPEQGMGVNSEWTWTPHRKIDAAKLAAASPTTEYMTEAEYIAEA